METEANNILFQKRANFRFSLLEKKNEIIEEIYKKAEKEIINLPDNQFKKWVVGVIPAGVKGKIKAGKKTAKVLGIESDLDEEGFLLVGEDTEIDFRISEILKRLKEDQKPELIKILCLNTPQE